MRREEVFCGSNHCQLAGINISEDVVFTRPYAAEDQVIVARYHILESLFIPSPPEVTKLMKLIQNIMQCWTNARNTNSVICYLARIMSGLNLKS